MPFRRVGEPDNWPSPCKVARLNLSATQLESISILTTDKYYDRVLGLMPELLPRTLKHVAVRSFTTRDTADSVLGLQYLLDSAARLPSLRSLSVTCRDFAAEERLNLYANDYPAGICQSVRFRGKVVVDAGATTCLCLSQARTVFEAAASLHIKSNSIVLECSDDALITLPCMLCPDSLQDCVLRCAAGICFVYGSNADKEIPIWDVIRMLLVQRSSAFAFACGTDRCQGPHLPALVALASTRQRGLVSGSCCSHGNNAGGTSDALAHSPIVRCGSACRGRRRAVGRLELAGE